MHELRSGFRGDRQGWDCASVVGMLCALLLDCGSCRIEVPDEHTSPDQIALTLCAWGNIDPLRVIIPCTVADYDLTRWMSTTMMTKRWVALAPLDVYQGPPNEMKTAACRTVSICYAIEPRIIEAVEEQPFRALLVCSDHRMPAALIDAVWTRAPRRIVVTFLAPSASFEWSGSDRQNRSWGRVQTFLRAKWTQEM